MITNAAGSFQVLIVVERMVLTSSEVFSEALFALISAYFAFDMAYPVNLRALLLFMQHLVMEVKDRVALPAIATRVYSALQAMD